LFGIAWASLAQWSIGESGQPEINT